MKTIHLIVLFALLFAVVSRGTHAVNVDPNYNATCSDSNILSCGEPFVCRNGFCDECEDSSQCHGYYSPAYECVPQKFLILDPSGAPTYANLKSCRNKDLFPNFGVLDGLAIVACFFGGALAASSGIGGGAIYVALLALLSRYPNRMAVPISTACIFGSAISNNMILFFRKHPLTNRPLINYSTALLTEPIILAGTIIGVFLNVMLPDWLTLILLIILFAFTVYRSTQKGIKTFKKETAANKKIKEQQAISQDHYLSSPPSEDHLAQDSSPLGNTFNDSSELQATPYSVNVGDDGDSESEINFDVNLNEIEEAEKKRKVDRILWFESWKLPPIKVMILFLAWLVVFLSSLLKGSKGNQSIIGVKSCREPLYWVIVLLSFPVMLLITFGTGAYLRFTHSKKLQLGYKFVEGDIQWTTKRAFLLPLLFLSAGIIAGLLGIGGGIIVGPLFLELGMHPEVSMATSSFMILFTSSSTMMQFVFMKSIKPYFALVYIVTGFLSGGTGQLIVGYLVKKTNRASIVIFIIAGCVALAAVLQGVVGIFNVVNQIKQGVLSFSNLGFRAPC